MKKITFLSTFIVSLLIFSFVSAASDVSITNICDSANMKSVEGIINWGTCLLSRSVVPLLFALATAAFIWGVTQYLLNPDNEEKRKKSKSFIIGGLIALFVMVSMWGIVKIFTKTFDVENNTLPLNAMPQFQ